MYGRSKNVAIGECCVVVISGLQAELIMIAGPTNVPTRIQMINMGIVIATVTVTVIRARIPSLNPALAKMVFVLQ